jgi:hypothetical protein
VIDWRSTWRPKLRSKAPPMTAFLQTAIPAVLTALIAGRIAWTRTSRLQRTINTNLDLPGRLPADHPNRAALEAHNGELLELLIRRQQRRFGPFTQAGVSFGALAGVAAVAFTFGCFSALLAAGVIPSASGQSTPGDLWTAAVFFLVVAAGFILAAVWSARRQLREHPSPTQQPTEAGLAPD